MKYFITGCFSGILLFFLVNKFIMPNNGKQNVQYQINNSIDLTNKALIQIPNISFKKIKNKEQRNKLIKDLKKINHFLSKKSIKIKSFYIKDIEKLTYLMKKIPLGIIKSEVNDYKNIIVELALIGYECQSEKIINFCLNILEEYSKNLNIQNETKVLLDKLVSARSSFMDYTNQFYEESHRTDTYRN